MSRNQDNVAVQQGLHHFEIGSSTSSVSLSTVMIAVIEPPALSAPQHFDQPRNGGEYAGRIGADPIRRLARREADLAQGHGEEDGPGSSNSRTCARPHDANGPRAPGRSRPRTRMTAVSSDVAATTVVRAFVSLSAHSVHRASTSRPRSPTRQMTQRSAPTCPRQLIHRAGLAHAARGENPTRCP